MEITEATGVSEERRPDGAGSDVKHGLRLD